MFPFKQQPASISGNSIRPQSKKAAEAAFLFGWMKRP